RRSRLRRHRQEPASRNRSRARAHRAAGRLLRHPQALPERRLLLGPDLPGDGLSGRDVPGAVRDSADRGLDRTMGRDAARPGAEARPATADLHRTGAAKLHSTGEARMTAALASVLALQMAAAPPPKFDSGRAWEHLRQLVAIGPRPSGSAAIEETRKYIRKQLAAVGLTPVEQVWDEQTPIDTVKMVNLSVTIPGMRRD